MRRGGVGRRDGVEDDSRSRGLGLVGGENGGRQRDMRQGGLVRRGGVGRNPCIWLVGLGIWGYDCCMV